MRTKLPFLAIAALLFGLWLAKERLPDPSGPPPDVAFKDLAGNTTALSDLRGRPVLIAFWATTCAVCISEIPDLIRLHQEFSSEGFRLYAVAVAYDPPNRVVETTRNWKLPYPVVLDLKADLANAFGSGGQIPANFLIAPDGSVAMYQLGRLDLQKVRFLIREMLEKSMT
jgi:peroxiredoxin